MHVYLGTFLIAFTTLALEITLSRLLSVITWYHMAFFAVSTAMLGMTAGATMVYLKPNWFSKEKLNDSIAAACLGFALIIPTSLLILCTTAIPIDFEGTFMHLLAVVIVTIACSFPFYFSGIAITAVLTKTELPIGKIYASDLIGASLGCIFVLWGMSVFDAPSMIILSGSVGALAALCFAGRSGTYKFRHLTVIAGLLLLILAPVNSFTSKGLRPVMVKGEFERPEDILIERWNSFSRIVVFKGRETFPQLWGESSRAPKSLRSFQHKIEIDGAAGTVLRRYRRKQDINHLRYDVTNIAYNLRPTGGACIIGVGGGRDILSAIYYGQNRIVGIELNPIFIDLITEDFKELAGINVREEVALVTDEARSYLSRTDETFAIIQMSLIDTWAATGAGAFTLSENALYTIDAWRIFFKRLAENGIFTVSRWYNPKNLGETGRLVSLATATLFHEGIENPAEHIAMITVNRISTLLISKRPFSQFDIKKLTDVCRDMRFRLDISPDKPPGHQDLRDIVTAESLDSLNAAIADKPLNYDPPTDENPYFFNMLRLNDFKTVLAKEPGVLRGNLTATRTLIKLIGSLLLLTLAAIVLPLIAKARSGGFDEKSAQVLWSGALYFSLIGAGFMFVEMALIQRLSVFLTHPVYALGILLFTMIASTGVGSYVSEYLPLTRTPWIFIYPVVTAIVILGIPFTLPLILSHLLTSAMRIKITASVVVIFPIGLLLGLFFPTGMRLTRILSDAETPWYWALNGIFGVLCSALAVFFSIYLGISKNFYIASACYAAILICLLNMHASIQRKQITG